MRRILVAMLCAVLLLGLTVDASAANAVSRADISAVVEENGSCQVTANLLLNMEFATSSLTFPLPEDARNITVNEASVSTSRAGGVTNVLLSEVIGESTGELSLQIRYTLPNVVSVNQLGKPQIIFPILSGFNYPVDLLLFSITLPGENLHNPVFSSGYYQQSIEASMHWDLLGTAVSGSVNTQLKDRETLTMTLEVSEQMFPQVRSNSLVSGFEIILSVIFGVLALLYWLLFMRCAPLLRRRCTTPPEGLTAGQLGCGLLGLGADLTMMVLTWAQLGYILIHTNDHGRVMLHKCMEMGNERSNYEVRVFQNLFGKKTTVDGSGLHYATLHRKCAAKPDLRDLFRNRSGNPRIFRVLCAGMGLCFGISLGIALIGAAVLGVLLVILLAVFCAVGAWFLQEWVLGLHLHYRRKLVIAGILAAVWLLLALIGGIFTQGLVAVGLQLLSGLFCFYGGRRTDAGRQAAEQILGLRKYLCSLSGQELQRILENDPDYFFTLIPYALALGVERKFARQFGKRRLSACPWLTSGLDGHMTAREWSSFMRQTVDDLDRRQKRLPLERLK